MPPVLYSVRARYLPDDPLHIASKVVNVWGGTPIQLPKDGDLGIFKEGLLLTVRNEDFGEPVELHAFPSKMGDDTYKLLFTLYPGEVRTFRLTNMQAVAAVVREPACDTLLFCQLHQFYYHVA